MMQFSQISSGGSIDGARILNSGDADISINWGGIFYFKQLGGLHHAKKIEAC